MDEKKQNILKIADFETLKTMSYEAGEKYLQKLGYIHNECAADYDCNEYDVIYDYYFRLYDDESEEIDVISYVVCANILEHREDDMDDEKIMKKYWDDSIRPKRAQEMDKDTRKAGNEIKTLVTREKDASRETPC